MELRKLCGVGVSCEDLLCGRSRRGFGSSASLSGDASRRSGSGIHRRPWYIVDELEHTDFKVTFIGPQNNPSITSLERPSLGISGTYYIHPSKRKPGSPGGRHHDTIHQTSATLHIPFTSISHNSIAKSPRPYPFSPSSYSTSLSNHAGSPQRHSHGQEANPYSHPGQQ